MSKPPVKYNPAFLSEEQLAAAFVVRHDDLNMVLNVIRENNGTSNQHVLVVGPRGIGKTMLMHRVALDVRQDEELSRQWYPLIFAEESYEVSSAGEFWLEAIFHLANQTGESKWTQAYEELRKEQDEDRLGKRAVAQLMDFADSQHKRILLVVENLNMILGDQLRDDCAWKLRHTLMHEPRVMLLATATANLDLPENINKAFFELFKTHYLRPLDDADCQIVWKAIAGYELGSRRIRALSILTGGNPRLLTIISHFGAQLSFSDLMQDLTALVDDHTDYFKSHLESLPPVERKVYVALADLWDPVMARDVAAAARLGVSKTSSLLKRLVSRGVVTEQPGKGRAMLYRVTERMYNVYYLMRRRGAPSERVRAAVHFMVQFYEEKEIIEITKRLGEEACRLCCEARRNHYYAVEGIIRAVSAEMRPRILKCIPQALLIADDRPPSLAELVEKINRDGNLNDKLSGRDQFVDALIKGIQAADEGDEVSAISIFTAILEEETRPLFQPLLKGMLCELRHQYEDAEKFYRKATEVDPKDAVAWERFGRFLSVKMNRYKEAAEVYREAVKLSSEYKWPRWQLARLLEEELGLYDEAETVYREILQVDDKDTWAWQKLGQILWQHTDRYAEAENAYRQAINLDGTKAWIWAELGWVLCEYSQKYDEAENAYKKALEIDSKNPLAWVGLGTFLHRHAMRYQDAENAYLKFAELSPDEGWIWGNIGQVREKLGNHEGAEMAYCKAVELDEGNQGAWIDLIDLKLGYFADTKTTQSLAEQALEKNTDSATLLNAFAWSFYDAGYRELLNQAVAWSRRAVELEHNFVCVHTLACLLACVGEYSESLALTKALLQDSELVETGIDDMTTLFAELAAGGQAEAVIPILRDSKCAIILEPVLVALRMSIGEEVAVAPEIEQIAKDVLKEFEAVKEKRHPNAASRPDGRKNQ